MDALSFKPINGLKGTYLVSPDEQGTFKSGRDGDVYIENLRVGITNI